MRVVLAAAAMAALLTGCQQQWAQEAAVQCTGFGYRPGSPEHAQCQQQLFMHKQMAAQNALSQIQTQQAIMNAYQPRPTNLTCSQMGAFTNCRAY